MISECLKLRVTFTVQGSSYRTFHAYNPLHLPVFLVRHSNAVSLFHVAILTLSTSIPLEIKILITVLPPPPPSPPPIIIITTIITIAIINNKAVVVVQVPFL